MSFPSTLTGAVDGVTEIIAAHLNNLEEKVGVDGSAVAASLDYLLKNVVSDEPGHTHTSLIKHSLATDAADFLVASGTGAFVKKTLAETKAILELPASPYVIGDLFYASSTTVQAKLAAVAVNNALISGGVGAAPSWGKVGLTTHVDGVLPDANGGTGVANGWTTAQDPGHKHSKLFASDGDPEAVTVDAAGNVIVGGSAVGATAAKVMGVNLGTAPTTFPADIFQMWAADIAAGNCAPHFATELGKVIKLYQQAHIADAKVDYAAGDLDTEAEVITAFNTTNGLINSLFAVLENLGFLATS